MGNSSCLTVKLTACAALLSATAAHPADSSPCDRACLRTLADGLMASIESHDSSKLALAATYAATENGSAAALPMMAIWRTASAIGARFYVIDPASGQFFFIVTVKEGAGSTLLFGRVKTRDRLLSEIELFENRSRGDGGFIFDGDGPSHLPAAWTQKVEAARLPSRKQLLAAGQSIFNTAVPAPAAAPGCRMMENGGMVAEDPKVLESVMPPGAPALPRNADGSVPIPCGSPPNRPVDPDARTDIVDEEQGIVISLANVQGIVAPYLITDPTISAFVPLAMFDSYQGLLERQRASGHFTRPVLKQTPASLTVAQIYRIYDGKLQGMHLLEHLSPPGAVSSWVTSKTR